jgi:hypothetical protein
VIMIAHLKGPRRLLSVLSSCQGWSMAWVEAHRMLSWNPYRHHQRNQLGIHLVSMN